MLTTAISDAAATGVPVESCSSSTAASYGRRLGTTAAEAEAAHPAAGSRQDAVLAVLSAHGYEPRPDGDDVVLRNCPFHRLAEAHRSLVCGMNRDFLAGMLDGLGETENLDARLDPQSGYCCVRITAA